MSASTLHTVYTPPVQTTYTTGRAPPHSTHDTRTRTIQYTPVSRLVHDHSLRVAASGTAESLRKQAVTSKPWTIAPDSTFVRLAYSAAASTLLSHPPSTARVVTLDDPSGIGGHRLGRSDRAVDRRLAAAHALELTVTTTFRPHPPLAGWRARLTPWRSPARWTQHNAP